MTTKPKQFKPNHSVTGSKKFDGRKNITDLYDSDWERYRLKFLKVNDKCYCCGNPSNVVDHIVPHKGDVKLFWKEENYMPLCDSCHNTITARFDKNYRDNSLHRKIQYLNECRLNRGHFVKVKVVSIDADVIRKIFSGKPIPGL
jgi:5-methylcytosine-specific restriction endonuclease McrA